MRRNSFKVTTALGLVAIASLSLLTGAGSTTPPQAGPTAETASGLYVRSSSGAATVGGRRVIVRAYFYNDYMPPINPRQAGLGNLQIVLEPNDSRGLPANISRVTAEISQGRLRWKGTLTPYANLAADTAIVGDFIGPTFGVSGVRTFPAGTKVTINLTIRANGRDTKVTLRNVEVGAAY
jgi:hypothetical protein